LFPDSIFGFEERRTASRNQLILTIQLKLGVCMYTDLSREDETIISLSKKYLSNYKAWFKQRTKKIEHFLTESNTKEKFYTLVLFLSDYVF
jgi:hypothetical protein